MDASSGQFTASLNKGENLENKTIDNVSDVYRSEGGVKSEEIDVNNKREQKLETLNQSVDAISQGNPDINSDKINEKTIIGIHDDQNDVPDDDDGIRYKDSPNAPCTLKKSKSLCTTKKSGEMETSREHPNLLFYQNKLKSIPHGDFIDIIHKQWFGQYDKLEKHHGYIQWLFPNTEDKGMNHNSVRLSEYEAKMISASPKLQDRVRVSYELILDFFGMSLKNKTTGEIERNIKNYEDRFSNLEISFHNYLRITRILKCLGDVGLGHYKRPFIQFVISEVVHHNRLVPTIRSLFDFWIPTLTEEDQKDLIQSMEKDGTLSKLKTLRNTCFVSRRKKVSSTFAKAKPKPWQVKNQNSKKPLDEASNKSSPSQSQKQQSSIKQVMEERRKNMKEWMEKNQKKQKDVAIEIYVSTPKGKQVNK